ncbi:hypothetical protein IG631_21434 [Alternaria alternata]|nr:hypothetical protein IG631_21434 [Alternaria alternata]
MMQRALHNRVPKAYDLAGYRSTANCCQGHRHSHMISDVQRSNTGSYRNGSVRSIVASELQYKVCNAPVEASSNGGWNHQATSALLHVGLTWSSGHLTGAEACPRAEVRRTSCNNCRTALPVSNTLAATSMLPLICVGELGSPVRSGCGCYEDRSRISRKPLKVFLMHVASFMSSVTKDPENDISHVISSCARWYFRHLMHKYDSFMLLLSNVRSAPVCEPNPSEKARSYAVQNLRATLVLEISMTPHATIGIT